MEKFIIDGRYGKLLAANGVDPHAVLIKADLPRNTFDHETIKLTEKEYLTMIEAIDELTHDPLMPTELVATDDIEAFSPAIFAAYCSQNGKQFLQRLAQYKKLIGPLTYQISETNETVTVTLSTLNLREPLPSFFVKGEFAFMVQLIAKATGRTIFPTKIVTTFRENDPEIQHYFGLQFEQGPANAITFYKTDLAIPFNSENTSILSYLEPELKKRLAELDVDDSYGKQVRDALVELLPRGEFTIENVARSLGVSKRTLQRKLSAENTNFQQQLNATREMLAKNYLINTTMTTDEIGFLLAYSETNSFLRAFNTWTGMSAQQYRQKHQ